MVDFSKKKLIPDRKKNYEYLIDYEFVNTSQQDFFIVISLYNSLSLHLTTVQRIWIHLGGWTLLLTTETVPSRVTSHHITHKLWMN